MAYLREKKYLLVEDNVGLFSERKLLACGLNARGILVILAGSSPFSLESRVHD